MSARLAEIRARREYLIAKSAAQRDQVAQLMAPWHKPLEVAGRGVAAAHYIRQHPAALVLAVAALALLAPRRALRWARRGFLIWRGYRWATRALGDFVH